MVGVMNKAGMQGAYPCGANYHLSAIDSPWSRGGRIKG